MIKSRCSSHVLACALIVLMSICIYRTPLQGDFIWDDRDLIVARAEYLNDWKNLYSAFVKPLFGDTPYYRPVLTASFIIDYHLWGANPFGFHCTNLIFHTANGFLVYLFALLLFKKRIIALFTSLLFIAHPIQSEAVAWISGRNDVLLTFFALISIILHVRRKYFRGWKRLLLYSGCLFTYMAALLTKESGLILPLMFLLIDYYYQESSIIIVRDYAGLVLISVAYYVAKTMVIGTAGIGLRGGELSDTFFQVIATYAYYFKMLLFPALQSAVPDVTGSVSGGHYLIYSFLLLTCLAAVAVITANRCKEIPCAILWVFLSLVPVCGIFPLSLPALEHRLYLGTVCFSMVLPCAVCRLSWLRAENQRLNVTRTVLALIIPAVLMFYSVKTVTRNDVWDNELSFWLNTVNDSPRSPVARNNLGIAYAHAGNHQMAIREFKQGLYLHDRHNYAGAGPNNVQRAKIFNNLGQCYYQLLLAKLPAEESGSDRESATIKRLYSLSLTCYQKSLAINPANNEVRTNLKDLFYVMRSYPTAEEEYRKASAARHGQL